ncbi:MAG: HNH endonuclease [Mycolicibacterium vanbaalenii]|uniref:HNH endonuclease n=1 Tax=Mycolicibacterium vanbaalenii TaxID=110539 RepID=UPI003568B957
MPKPRLKPCAQPGCPELQQESRCPQHRRENNRYRRQFGSKASEPRDRARRKATVDAHRAQHGDWCPGYGREPHASADLTADHIDEVSLGGDPHGPLQTLCRSCNGRKNATRQNRVR